MARSLQPLGTKNLKRSNNSIDGKEYVSRNYLDAAMYEQKKEREINLNNSTMPSATIVLFFITTYVNCNKCVLLCVFLNGKLLSVLFISSVKQEE